MKIIVTGAGLSGLATAYRLRRLGHEVKILESSDRPGGRCRRMYPRFGELDEEFGTKFRYMRMIDIKLAYRKRTRSKAWMVMSPFCEDASLKLPTLTHNKAPVCAPPGHSLLSIFTEDCEYERQTAQTDEELVAWARGRVEALHPELKGHFLFHYLSREPRTCCFPMPVTSGVPHGFWIALGRNRAYIWAATFGTSVRWKQRCRVENVPPTAWLWRADGGSVNQRGIRDLSWWIQIQRFSRRSRTSMFRSILEAE